MDIVLRRMVALFHIFNNKEERRAFGGSSFVELQYCRLNLNSKLKKIVSLRHIKHWLDDSLYVYVDDIDDFMESYGDIFNDGRYNNKYAGPIDIYGINYYDIEQVKSFMVTTGENRPKDYKVLMDWLTKALDYNGFYILGI